MCLAEILAAFALLTVPGEAAQQVAGEMPSPAAAESVAEKLPLLIDWLRRGDQVLRNEAAARDPGERAAAIVALCDFQISLANDSRLGRSESLRELQSRLESRLRRIRDELQQAAAKRRAGSPAANLLLATENPSGKLAQAARENAGGGPGAFDHGPELVELIQRVISPDIWDVNGGRSSIVYFAPLKVLVVAAPAEVQGQVGGLVEGLRAAGR